MQTRARAQEAHGSSSWRGLVGGPHLNGPYLMTAFAFQDRVYCNKLGLEWLLQIGKKSSLSLLQPLAGGGAPDDKYLEIQLGTRSSRVLNRESNRRQACFSSHNPFESSDDDWSGRDILNSEPISFNLLKSVSNIDHFLLDATSKTATNSYNQTHNSLN
uniref:Putative secreted protein n=1 Tax=Ixodes ricinus TaxID=34613 RepID=A0A0K8RH83_IXORI